MILVREAGGLVGRIGEAREAEDPMATGDIVAAAPDAYRPLMRFLGGPAAAAR